AHACRILVNKAFRIRHLVAYQPAERADPFADDKACGTAELLTDSMRNLRQVVEDETQVIVQGSGLSAEVLHHLQVLSPFLLARERQHIARVSEHLERDLWRRVGQRLVVAT